MSLGNIASDIIAAKTRESIGFAPLPKSDASHTIATIPNARIADGLPPHAHTYRNSSGSAANG